MNKENCLFCQIINKKISAEIIYEDKQVVVIPDQNPKKRIHFLILPSMHISSFLDLQNSQYDMLTKMAKVVQRLIIDQKVENGYQLLFNGGSYQHIPHLHWHMMGD